MHRFDHYIMIYKKTTSYLQYPKIYFHKLFDYYAMKHNNQRIIIDMLKNSLSNKTENHHLAFCLWF